MTSVSKISRKITENDHDMSDSIIKISEHFPDDEKLMIEAAQQNPAEFRVLYNKYYTAIFRFILKRTADESLTADLTSQVFLKAMKKMDTYEYRGLPFSSWLYRIATNEITQFYRKNAKKRVVSIDEKMTESWVDDEVKEDDYEMKKKIMLDLLSDLKEGDLELIELRFFENRSFKEIAEILDMTENNAKVKTYRIVERLKKKGVKKLDSFL